MTGAAPTAVMDRQVHGQEQTTDDSDHDRFAHYVRKDKITQAALQRLARDRTVRQGVGARPRPREVPGGCRERSTRGSASRTTAVTAQEARAAPAVAAASAAFFGGRR